MKLSQFSLPVAAAWFEDLVFRHRITWIVVFAALTGVAVWMALSLKVDATLERQLPSGHPFVQTALDTRDKIPGLNSIQVVLEVREGQIWTPAFLKILYDATQDLLYLPGIDRTSVASMWTPNTRIYEAAEGAVNARDLIPSSVSADRLTDADVATIRDDAYRGGFRGELFSFDNRAAMILASIQDMNPQTGRTTDLFEAANALESQIRAKYERDGVVVRITGFTPFMGEVSREAQRSVLFFVLASLVAAVATWIYARSVRLAALAVFSSALALVWLAGLMGWSGLTLSPLGLIVPFLVFAIGVSHGVQQIHQFLAARLAGADEDAAARKAFRVLAAPGGYALATCCCAFAALLAIPIPLVQDLAVVAILGLALVFVTNLLLLPMIMSLLRFTPGQLALQNALVAARGRWVDRIAADAHPLPAAVILALSLALAGAAFWTTTRFVGDVTRGASELWQSARFNVDTAAVTSVFTLNTDLLVVVVDAPPDSCIDYKVLSVVERLGVALRETPGVRRVMSLPEASRTIYSIVQEGNLKWRVLAKDSQTLALTTSVVPTETGLLNKDCTLLTVAAYLDDHRHETLTRVTDVALAFTRDPANKIPGMGYRIGTGNAALLSAINETIADKEWTAMGLAFAATAILVLAAFRDWRAIVACCAPLALATIFGHWMMSSMTLGLKISTLPVLVIATGVGVDYAFYLHNRLIVHLREGMAVDAAYILAMQEKGAAIVFTGLVLATSTLTWALSGLKFQADMGLLLSFMFMVNLILAVTLLPALTVLLELAFPHATSLRRAKA